MKRVICNVNLLIKKNLINEILFIKNQLKLNFEFIKY